MHDFGQQSRLIYGFELDPLSVAKGVVRWLDLLESGDLAPTVHSLTHLAALRCVGLGEVVSFLLV